MQPPVEAVGPLSALADSIPIQKMIFMAPQSRIDVMRAEVETAMAGRASLTTALEGMLEVGGVCVCVCLCVCVCVFCAYHDSCPAAGIVVY